MEQHLHCGCSLEVKVVVIFLSVLCLQANDKPKVHLWRLNNGRMKFTFSVNLK